MKTYKKYLNVKTSKRIEFVNITSEVESVIKESGIKEGLVLVNAMHITASVFVNDNEEGLLKDFEGWLERIAPKDKPYRHNLTGEYNAYAHLWRTIMGREVLLQ